MGVTTTQTNKPLNPRGNDQSPLAYNRAKLFSGKALDFDGSNDIVTLDGFTMSGNIATISFYLKADDWDANSFIFAAGTPEIVLGSTTGGNNLSFYDSSSWQTFGAISDTTSTNFFSIVFSGTSAIAYMNGVKFGNTLTITPINISSVTGVKLMSKYTGDAFFFNGQIAGFKIFNTALTAAQVADLYNNPELVVPTGVDNTALKLWLPMQEGAGTTAYDGSGNNLGSEELTNGDFATDSDWTKEAGWTISGGKATFNGSAATSALYQNIGGVSGTKYLLSFEVTDYVSGSVKAYFSNGDVSASTPSINANGKYVFDITATGVLCLFRNETSFNGSIDNVSVKELTSYGTISGATWTHGIGAPVAQTSVIDWNKWTLDGSNDILIPQGLTSGRDLLGNLFENVRKQGALNLDGNSWAEVHDNASLDVTTGVSVEAWVDWVSPSASKGILAKWGSSSALYAWLFQARSNSAIRLYIYDGTNYLVESSTLTEGWRHLCATYDGVTLRMYIDGQADTTTAHTGSIPSVQEPVKIGAYGAVTSTTYENDIAQPRIYNRALTAAEVQKNYNAGKNTYTN